MTGDAIAPACDERARNLRIGGEDVAIGGDVLLAFLGRLSGRQRQRRCGSGASISVKRVSAATRVRLFAGDDVLIGVVEIVVADDAGRRFVPLQQREPFGGEVGQKLLQLVLLHAALSIGPAYAFCFSLQLMQDRVHGIAVRRASAIGSPQSRQMP